jgi:hypothetical protein
VEKVVEMERRQLSWQRGGEVGLLTTYPAAYPRSIQPGLLFLVEISEAE